MKTGLGIVQAALAVGLACAAVPGLAQDVFNLPPGSPSPTARPAGPVDSDAPVIQPRPTQSAAAQPSTAPATRAAPSAAPRQPAVRQTAAARPASTASTSAPSAPQIRPSATAPAAQSDLPPAIPTAAPAATASAPAAEPSGTSNWAAFATGALVGALALLALVGGLLWRRRQPGRKPDVTFEAPVVPAMEPEWPPAATPKAAPTPTPAPAPTSPAESVVAAKPTGLHIALEARRLDASLVATTLAYNLTLTNHGTTTLSAIAVEGDMVAAHASLPVEKQIANTAQRLDLRHALLELAPGETANFSGEMRLPLAAITPIRSGNTAYFVPLVRLRTEAAQAASEPLVLAQTFVIGELPEQPGGALRPFRLDLGPRTFGKLGQRAVG